MIIDHVEFDREPPANLTTMVMAFGGWIDAGQAATDALRHLARDLPAARLARMDAEQFFVFTQEWPNVRLTADGGRDIQWRWSKAGAFTVARPTKARRVFLRSCWRPRSDVDCRISA